MNFSHCPKNTYVWNLKLFLFRISVQKTWIKPNPLKKQNNVSKSSECIYLLSLWMFFQDGSRSVENETTLITWDPNRSPKKRCPHRPHGPPKKNTSPFFPPKKLQPAFASWWFTCGLPFGSFPNGGRCHWGFTLLGDLWRYLATHRPRRQPGSGDGWSALDVKQTLRCGWAFDHGKGGWLFLTLTGIFGASFSGMMIWYLLEIWGQNSIQAQIPIRKCQCIMTYQWYVMILPVIVYQWNCLFQGVTMTNSSPQFPKGF